MKRVLLLCGFLLFEPKGLMAKIYMGEDLLVGEGVSRSTFSSAPSGSEPSVSISSGLSIARGGVRYPDGSTQFSSFQVNFSTRTTPISYTIIGAMAAISGSTTTITLIKDQSTVRVSYVCDGNDETGDPRLTIWALRGESLIGGETLTPTSRGMAAFSGSTRSFRGTLYDGPLTKGTYSYSLMGASSGGDSAIRNNQVCVFSLEELPQ